MTYVYRETMHPGTDDEYYESKTFRTLDGARKHGQKQFPNGGWYAVDKFVGEGTYRMFVLLQRKVGNTVHAIIFK